MTKDNVEGKYSAQFNAGKITGTNLRDSSAALPAVAKWVTRGHEVMDQRAERKREKARELYQERKKKMKK